VVCFAAENPEMGTIKGTDAAGHKIDSVPVYDKQKLVVCKKAAKL
jgi:hypothetical protein